MRTTDAATELVIEEYHTHAEPEREETGPTMQRPIITAEEAAAEVHLSLLVDLVEAPAAPLKTFGRGRPRSGPVETGVRRG